MANPILSAFNNQLNELIADIQRVFPNDPDILAAQKAISMVRSANPRMISKIWYLHIAVPYNRQIEAGDIYFFIQKDYSHDIAAHGDSQQIQEAIDRLRKPVSEMDDADKAIVMKYLQNLARLSIALHQ